jgi:hypothetical protein
VAVWFVGRDLRCRVTTPVGDELFFNAEVDPSGSIVSSSSPNKPLWPWFALLRSSRRFDFPASACCACLLGGC